ncbi:MAG TPA: LCP family protein [Propionibacteriaceae bacterium]|nr:LCP family protein [Propionibacteriaceae bacterium]
MPGPRDEDLDWLYGRDRRPAEPEHTRVMPFAEQPVPPPSTPHPAAAPPPSAIPRGYPPPRPAYGSPPNSRPPNSPPPYGAPPAAAARPPRKRRPVRNTFRVLGIVLLLVLVWLIGVPAHAWSQVERVDAAPPGARPGNQPGQTFLLVGSDSREGLSRAERKKLGTGSTGGQRTDTIMIVYSPPGGEPALISVPRDSYLPIPDNGSNKINAAYAFGGAQLLVRTVEQNTGLRVDGYLEIGFGGFVNIIDSLGGIKMCLPKAVKDRDAHINLPKGCQTLGGVDALGYVRMRKADPRGDLGRVERQREMLAAIADKAASPASVLNPVRYWNVCHAAAGAIKVGEDTSLRQVITLGLAMRTISSGNGLTLTVPISNPGASTSAGSAVLWDDAKAKAMFADIARGDTSDLKKYAK